MISSTNLEDNAVIGNEIELLQDIHLKTKNIAICQRGIEHLREGLRKAAQCTLEFCESGSIQEITSSLNTYFTSELPEQMDLLEDVLYLLKSFKKITESSSFRVSLVNVKTTMCPRFHADHNQLRMLCTYHGPGTLWLPDYAVDRQAYLTGKGNQKILADESHARQVNAGDVVILKGTLYQGSTPILHCSPNIEEDDKERILLTIDVNEPLACPRMD
ncbi:DUF1826 domain-containing protein [Flagellimonas sp.]|uniref:DUF1826 domain-containing protein n=1 Tax=Flagellimonas sp. TaxID=2058762 RepID=UPI003F4A300E